MKTLLTLLLTSLLSISIVNTAYADFNDGLNAAKSKDYDTALNVWMPLAKQGDIDAQSALSQMYFQGKGFKQNYKQAFKWLTKAAEQGHANSQYNLGIMYRDGLGVSEDSHKYFYWLDLAAKQGDSKAQKQIVDLTMWLTKAAEQGDADAQTSLGLMYYIKQDYKQAIKWFTKAAEQGHANSQYNLAILYYQGEGVKQDYKQVIKWGTKAAEQGDADAQHYLARLYLRGEEIEKDNKKAVYWFTKAAEQGDADAQFVLGLSYGVNDAYRGLIGVDDASILLLDYDYNKGMYWLKKLVEQGDVGASQILPFPKLKELIKDLEEWGSMPTLSEDNFDKVRIFFGAQLLYGLDVEKNQKTALFWMEKSHPVDPEFQYRLGLMYLDDSFGKTVDGRPVYFEKAAYWIKKAANQRYTEAKVFLEFRWVKEWLADVRLIKYIK